MKDIADPQNLTIRLWVNGELRQQMSTGRELEKHALRMPAPPERRVDAAIAAATRAFAGWRARTGPERVKLLASGLGLRQSARIVPLARKSTEHQHEHEH